MECLSHHKIDLNPQVDKLCLILDQYMDKNSTL